MKIAIASDHGGFELKEKLKGYLKNSLKCDIVDLGTNSAGSVDYPDFAHKSALMVSSGEAERAVLICGSGIGMCMAANRHKNVRAAVLHDPYDAEMSRLHNDANVACLGGRVTSFKKGKKLLDIWFATSFEGGRHTRRVEKIELP